MRHVIRSAGKALLATATATLLVTGLVGNMAVAGTDQPTVDEGTVKVALPGSTRHKPHTTCAFDVLLHGFGADATGSLAFFAKGRSGGTRQLLLEEADKPLSGNPDPARYSYTATQLGLGDGTTGVRMHRKHGYHVKLVVTPSTGETTGKVFWVRPCPTPTA